MAQRTDCATPGAIFTIHIGTRRVSIDVALPMDAALTLTEAVQLERNLHNAVELALAPLFLREG